MMIISNIYNVKHLAAEDIIIVRDSSNASKLHLGGTWFKSQARTVF
jgi:hypothetical protein